MSPYYAYRRRYSIRFWSILILSLVVILLGAGLIFVSVRAQGKRTPPALAGPIRPQAKKTAAPRPAAAERIDPDAELIGNTTYPFSAATGVALEDMSSGTTQLIAASDDDSNSSLTNIGFDFWYDGVRFTSFATNTNGFVRMGAVPTASGPWDNGVNFATTSDAPKIAPYWDDLCTGSTGKVHTKMVGTAPNRKRVIEWQNMQISREPNGCTETGTGTFQVWLFEPAHPTAPGVIEFVYGAGMTNAGIDSGYTIGFQSGAATNFASITAASNAISYDTANNTQTDTITPGQAYLFSPTLPTAPTNLSFTGVSSGGMTLNWTDAPDEQGYAIYYSPDGTNYSFFGSAAANATSFAATGLTPGVNNFWSVYSVSAGALSLTALSGSQVTNPAATYFWTGATGAEFNTGTNWNTAANGSGTTRTSPQTTDIMVIDGAGTTAGAAVTITVNASTSIGVLRVTSNTTMTLRSFTTTTRTVSITGGAGDDLDIQAGSSLIVNNATMAAAVNFTTGIGMTGNIAGTVTLGGVAGNALNTTGGTGTVVTVASTGIVNNSLGTFTGSAATLMFANGATYNHQFTTTSGTIPTATWGASSNVNITGFTTPTSIGGVGQTFGNFTWNCTAQTANFSLAGTVPTIAGIFTVSSTGSGTLRMNANSSATISAGAFAQTGGTLDLSSGTGSGTLRVAGTFNKSGGTITESGTGGANLIEFNGTTSQAVTIAGTLSNTISYRINNNAGIALTGTIPVTTGASMTVSSGGTPITGGTVTYAGTTALVYNSTTAAQTASGEFPSASGPTNLTINNTNASPNNTVTIPFSRSLAATGVLTLTSGILANGSNLLTIGNTAVGGISGGSATSYVRGAVARTLPASLTGTLTYTWPVGKGSYNPFQLVNPTTNAGGSVVVQSEAFDTNSGGTPGANMGSLNTDRYWGASIISGAGNFTSSFIRLNDASANSSSAIASSSSVGGTYDIVGGTSPVIVAGTSVTSVAPAATGIPGFYVLGTKSVSMTYVSSTTTQGVVTPVIAGQTNQQVIGIQIVTTGNTSPINLTSLSVNTNGTTAPLTDISNARIWYTGSSSAFATTTQFGTTVAVPNGSFDVTGSLPLSEGTNYFWLTYDIPNSATLNNVIDAECTSLTVGSVQTPSVTAPAGTRTIKTPLSGTYTIGASQVAPNYTRLTDAFAELNAYGVSGPVVLQLAADYNSATETFPLTVNQLAGASSTNTLTIRPAAGVTASISGTSANAILKLNGADFVTIDGSNSGGTDRSLTVANTATNNNRAGIWLSSLGAGQGATNNTIKNANLVGGTTTNSSNGVAITGATVAAAGADNDNNTIQGNSFRKLFNGVLVSGTAATSAGGDDNLLIANNLIGPDTIVSGNQIGGSGILVTNAVAPSLTGNTIRNLSTNVNSAALAAFVLNAGVSNATINQNTITDISTSGSGAIAYGIYVGATSPGANVTQTSIANVTSSELSSVAAVGLMLLGTNATVDQVTIANVSTPALGGSSTAAYGIFVGAPGASVTRTSVSGIVNGASAGYRAAGIYVNTNSLPGAVTLANNLVSDVQSYSDPSGQFQFQPVGIFIENTSGINLYFNSVNLSGSHPGLVSATKQTDLYVESNVTNLDVRNNIFADTYDNSSSGTEVSYAIYSNAPAGAFTSINYNDYFTAGTIGFIGGSDRADLAAWRTATGQDLQSLSADPLFNSPTNLQPQPGSPVLAVGTPIGGITVDYAGVTRNVVTPSIGGFETGADSSGPNITYTPLLQTPDTTNRLFDNVTITDPSGVNTTAGTRPRVYYKRLGDANTFVDNTSSTNGWKYAEANGVTSPYDFTIDYSRLNGGGVTPGQTIQYFVVAQDLSPTPYLSINSGNFAAPPTSVALTSAAFPVGGTINSYDIFLPLTGTINICDGGIFPTLTSFFDAVNSGTVTGNLTVNIAGDCNEAPNVTASLREWSEFPANSNFTMRIVPFGGVPRTITGTPFPSRPLVEFDGPDRVTIDGLNTGGNSLTISNTTASAGDGTSTFTFKGDATNNVITNCTILGSTTAANGGTITFGEGINSGNDNNTISNNNIGPAGSNLPGKGIFSLGVAGGTTAANSGVIIDHNNIYDFFDPNQYSSGIFLSSGNDQWTISNNRIYQTAPRTFAIGLTYTGITLTSGSAPYGVFSVTGNTIGFANAAGTGTTTILGADNLVRGIEAPQVDTATPTSIQGNVIAGFAQTSSHSGNTSQDSPFIGISVGAFDGLFNIGTVTGNTIGSQTGTGSITVTATGSSGFAPVLGILDFSLTEATSNIANNNIGSITVNGSTTIVGAWGIRVSGPAVSNITNNTIGGATANNITVSGISAQAVGIWLDNTRGAVTGNTIRNLQHTGANTNTFNSAAVIGINAEANADNQLVSNNNIYALSATASAAVQITGIDVTGPATGTNLVSGNLIHSLTANSTAATLNGIVVQSGATTYANNMIRLGVDAAGASITTALKINGVSVNSSNGDSYNFYNNSIYIGGSGVGATVSNTFAMNCLTTGNSRVFRNNIFSNTRSNSTTGGKHYAITLGGSGTNPTGLTTNSNLYNVSGTGGVLGLYNSADRTTIAAWRTATGQDALTNQADPLFKVPNGTTASLDLHIPFTSPAIAGGVTVAGITTDFDGDPRPASAPDIGADQIVRSSAGAFPAGSYFNASLNGGDTLAGDVTVRNSLTLNGLVNTAGFTLTLDCGGSVTGASSTNYVLGTLRKNFCSAGPFSYPVGTANGYSPVDVTVTSSGGTPADSLSVKAVQGYFGQNGETPALDPISLKRYWDLNKTGSITADIKWNFLAGDVVGGGAGYNIIRINGVGTTLTNAADCPANPNASPCVNIGGNYMFMAGVSNFSKWTAGKQLAPTASGSTIGGRVLDANGRPIANARVMLNGTGGQPKVVQTGPFGYYQFVDVTVGQTYVLTVSSGRHTFATPSRVINLTTDALSEDFISEQ